jgi:hypothetical protein
MKTQIINIDTIHGKFDFEITPIEFTNSISVKSEILFDDYILSQENLYNNEGEIVNMFVGITQYETNIHLYDLKCTNCFIDFNYRIDENEFEKVIDFILTEYN